MRLTIERSRRSRRDILEAADWYDSEAGTIVAERFVEAVESALRFLAENPHAAAVRDFGNPRLAGLRRWRLDRFPYYLYYMPDSDRIRLYHVVHTSRDQEQVLQSGDE